MSNNSIKAYKIAIAIVFLTCLFLGQNPATAEQKSSDKWRVSPRLARTENPIAPDTDSVASGKKLYWRECLQCHGETGKGDGSMAAYMGTKVADLTSEEVLAQTDGALYTKIRTGRPPMPGFKNSLAKDEIWQLINFIRADFGSMKDGLNPVQKSVSTAKSQSNDKAHDELFKKSEFPSAQECGACHQQIYREWSVSRHAFAQISPTFLAYQATLVKLTKGTLGDFCERCHTEVGMYSGEPILTSNSNRSKVAMEGITCVVCHRVPEAYGKITGRFPLESGDIYSPIYGPRKGDELKRVLNAHADNPPKTHREARMLEQVSQPGFCARCHDVRLVNGVRFEDLFSEYKQTPAAKRGETCQSCHMGPTPGIASDYPYASAAIVRGESTRPARRTNHMFPGPDSSVVHPGIFPINSEAQEFAKPEEWLSFDVEAGWGTEKFENNVPKNIKFPGIWADPEERKTAREIIDQQLQLLAVNRAAATILMRNGYGLGEVKILEKTDGLKFDIEVKNLTDGHSVPTGLIAERNVFLQVTVTDAAGAEIFRSGDLDPNGDVRDTHSLYVHDGSMPRDEQLFNLRSPILVGTIHGGEREQVLPANYSLNPLIFTRPSDTPSLLFGGIRDLRLQKKSIEAKGNRWASYNVDSKFLTGQMPYRLNIKLVAGQLPPHLINAISGAGFEYGLSARAIGDKLVDLYRVLWERNVVIE
jgi:mono/diheme cytochrome c family protein/nitrate/TMAO reductase-like tetraheme cytochrome c subunit